MSEKDAIKIRDEICRKIRMVATEFGNDIVKNSIIVTNMLDCEACGGVKVIVTPTVNLTLGNVEYKVARFFEDV